MDRDGGPTQKPSEVWQPTADEAPCSAREMETLQGDRCAADSRQAHQCRPATFSALQPRILPSALEDSIEGTRQGYKGEQKLVVGWLLCTVLETRVILTTLPMHTPVHTGVGGCMRIFSGGRGKLEQLVWCQPRATGSHVSFEGDRLGVKRLGAVVGSGRIIAPFA